MHSHRKRDGWQRDDLHRDLLRVIHMRAIFLALLLALSGPVLAQANYQPAEAPTVIENEQPIPVPVHPPARVAPLTVNTKAQPALGPEFAAASPQPSPEIKYRAAYYAHLDRMNHITEGKFVWQDRASEVTLWLVVFIVVSGVGLSFFQIWIAFHRGRQVGDTSIEASVQNFRVTSSVVGIIVLLISTGFLYLFLQHVYDIKVVDLRAPATQRAETVKPKTAADYGLPPPDVAANATAPPANAGTPADQ